MMKCQIMAQEALLIALIDTLDDNKKSNLQHNFNQRAEEIKAEVLNSMATDELYERLLEHLDRYSKTVNLRP
ncbi:hypothetical protein GL58_25770 [Comamonas testosteroni]|uniref:Uncharacterized protein n=2 Tax=Comamonas testosteroni TaxID=285 RepID=A0A0L7MAV9_COMTE|nr:hypothetical protein GL58_25770 [Comamonas testosteroni]KWT73764.1 hypothetical protein APV28_0730 [Comamonas testosteroni]